MGWEAKRKHYVNEAENLLGSMSPEHPELSQAWMLCGIGYALLAVANELQVIGQNMKVRKKDKEEK